MERCVESLESLLVSFTANLAHPTTKKETRRNFRTDGARDEKEKGDWRRGRVWDQGRFDAATASMHHVSELAPSPTYLSQLLPPSPKLP